MRRDDPFGLFCAATEDTRSTYPGSVEQSERGEHRGVGPEMTRVQPQQASILRTDCSTLYM